MAAAIDGRLLRRAGFRLHRRVGSSPVRDDLELVVGIQRLEGLEELASQ